MVWAAILALGAGPVDRPAVEARPDRQPASVHAARPVPARVPGTISAPRRTGRRPFTCPWTVSGLDECGAGEVDETWILEHDAAGSDSAAWPGWGPPRAGTCDVRIAPPDRPRPHPTPLRC